ncbi:hypothetical protein [Hymenobacter sp. HD11105]
MERHLLKKPWPARLRYLLLNGRHVLWSLVLFLIICLLVAEIWRELSPE